jgi:hypothetical protein
MAALLSTHDPMRVVSTISGNAEATQSFLEAATQTFPAGSIVSLNGSGDTIAWAGTAPGTTPAVIGVTALPGGNYATAGAGASPIFGNYGFPGGVTYGSVPNQPNAVNILHGAPFITGETLVWLAVSDTIFEGQVDASSGSTYNATEAIVGTQLGVTIDSGGSMYIDLAKTTVGTNTLVLIVGLDPLDLVSGSVTTQVNNGHVYFKFIQTLSQATT